MTSILFVDDEPHVLNGLRRMLHGMRGEWQMEFVANAEEALARTTEQTFDVVVSDMRMPGIDGAQLLEQVMCRCPDTVRIILSGQSDREKVLKSVGHTHQFLAKPCEPETLKHAIQRACALRQRLRSEQLRQLISQVTSLPSLPSLYAQIVAILDSPDVALKTIGEIIGRDVAMTAKLLQLVNSAFFCMPREVASPVQAVTLLGADTVKALVLSAGIFTQFDERSLPGGMLENLNDHSLAVAALAKRIALAEGGDSRLAEDAFLAGVVHDIGKLVLAANLGEPYLDLLEQRDDALCSLSQLERESLGADHAAVGAYLLGLWGSKDAIVEAVAFHHGPADRIGDDFSALAAVHVADALVREDHGGGARLDYDYLERLHKTARLAHWQSLSVVALGCR